MAEVFRAWLTKYALTTGVKVCAVEECSVPGLVSPVGRRHDCYHGEGKDWHRTRESAVARVETMRQAKIASLRKSLAKFEGANIEVPE